MATDDGTTIDDDKGYRELLGQIDIMKGSPHVDVGFFAGNDPAGNDGDLSIAEYMFINEVGTSDGTIPERPVFAQTTDGERKTMQQLLDLGIMRIAIGKSTVSKVLTLAGMEFQGKLRQGIVDFDTPENKMSTQIKKGGSPDRPVDNPLFDKGTAASAVTFEVKE